MKSCIPDLKLVLPTRAPEGYPSLPFSGQMQSQVHDSYLFIYFNLMLQVTELLPFLLGQPLTS